MIKNSGSVRLKAQLLLTQRFDNTCLPQAYISILNLYGNYTFYKKKQNQTLYDNSKQPASKLLILIPLLFTTIAPKFLCNFSQVCRIFNTNVISFFKLYVISKSPSLNYHSEQCIQNLHLQESTSIWGVVIKIAWPSPAWWNQCHKSCIPSITDTK